MFLNLVFVVSAVLQLAGCSDVISSSFAAESSPLGAFESARLAEQMRLGSFRADRALCRKAGFFCHPYGKHGDVRINIAHLDARTNKASPAAGDFKEGARSLEGVEGVLGGNAHFGDLKEHELGGNAHFGDFKETPLGANAHFGDFKDHGLGGNAHFGDFKETALGGNAHFGDFKDHGLGGNAHFGDFKETVLGGNAHFGDFKDHELGGNAHFGDFKDRTLGGNAHFGDFEDHGLGGNAHFDDFKDHGLGGNAHFGDFKDLGLGGNAHFGDFQDHVHGLGSNAHFGDFKDTALGGNAHFGDFKDEALGENAHLGDFRDASLGGNAHFGDFQDHGLGGNAHFGDFKDRGLGGNAHFGDFKDHGSLGGNAHFGDFKDPAAGLGGNGHFGDFKDHGLGSNTHFGDLKDTALGGNAHFGDFKPHKEIHTLGGNAHFGDFKDVLGGNAHFDDHALGANAHFGDSGAKDTTANGCKKNMPLYLIQVFTQAEYENVRGRKALNTRKDWPAIKALIKKCDPGMLHHFFTLEELHKKNGTESIVHNIRDTYPPRALLPNAMAKYTNFGKRTLDSYLTEFNVPKDSPLARKMAFTLELCNDMSNSMVCVASVEQMADFVTSTFGPVEISMFTGSKDFAAQVGRKVKLGEASPITKGDAVMVVCHTTMFPYKVYFCHKVSATSASKVKVTTSEGVDLTVNALCHKLGRSYVCHWFVETVIMFVPTAQVSA